MQTCVRAEVANPDVEAGGQWEKHVSPRGAQGSIAHVAAVTAHKSYRSPVRFPQRTVVPVTPVGPGPRECLPEDEETLETLHEQ